MADYAKESIAACIKTSIVSGKNGKLLAPRGCGDCQKAAAEVKFDLK
ncbi:hypothetical protein [Desulfofarcimen acetoxidans]|nr:hypothetical protein [Desulfofarcimen acetoxidans]